MVQSFSPSQTLQGVPRLVLGAAIHKLCISSGLSNAALEKKTGYFVSTLYRFFNYGEGSERLAANLLQTLNLTGAEAVERANLMPEITHASIDAAIGIMLAYRQKTQVWLVKQMQEHYPARRDEEGHSLRPKGFECDCHRARLLECESIGDMLSKARAITQEIHSVPGPELVRSVEALRIARYPLTKAFYRDAQIRKEAYCDYLARNDFPNPFRARLPAVFKVSGLQNIVEEAGKLEPVPARLALGQALLAHYYAQHKKDPAVTMKSFGDKGQLSEYYLGEMFKGCETLPEAIWRRTPALVRVGSMAELVETSKSLPVTSRRVMRHVTPAVDATAPVEQSLTVCGHWTHLVNQAALSKAFGREGGSI